MAVIDSAGTGDWDAGATWVGGSVPGAADDARVLNTHTVTLTQDELTNSLYILSGGTLAGGGCEVTLDGRDGSGNVFRNAGTISGELNMKITTKIQCFIRETASGSINNLTIEGSTNSSNNILFYRTTISGNLIITSGFFQSNFPTDDSNGRLDVTGNVINNGTLGGSTWLSNLTIGGRLEVSGTYNGASTQSITCGQIQIKEGATWSGPGIDKIDTDYVLSGSYPPELIGLTEHPRSINYKRVINYDRFINKSKFKGM